MALPEPMIGAPLSATGGVRIAPIGTALPTDAKTDPDPAFISAGLIGEDGVSVTQDRSTDKMRAWGGGVARILQTEYGETLKFTFLESSSADVLKNVFGDENVTSGAGGAIVVKHNKMVPARRAFVIDVKDGNRRRRLVVPNGQLSLSGDITYVHTDCIKYEVEVECFEDTNGNTLVEYISTDA